MDNLDRSSDPRRRTRPLSMGASMASSLLSRITEAQFFPFKFDPGQAIVLCFTDAKMG